MQPIRYILATGQAARNFRKRLASRCDRPGDSILTTKFRLECPQEALEQLGLETTNALYDVLEGTGVGSLTYLVFTLQSCGFRIFPKYADAKAFADRNAYRDAEFVQAVEKIIGKEWKGFTPSAIVIRLQTEVRARAGKDNRFVKEVIDKEYGKTFKSQGNEVKEKIILTIAESLSARFTSWGDIKARMDEACSAVDEALESVCGPQLPSIAAMYAAAKSSETLPSSTTIVFDPESDPYVCNPEILPYCAVATALSHFNTPDAANAQTGITTKGNHEGLSWLLGSGLAYIRKSSVGELQKAYGVPQEKILAVEQLKDAVDAVPPQTFFHITSEDTYSKFRQNLGGHLDSWIANYVSRLVELESMLERLPSAIRLPEGLAGEEYAHLFEGISISMAEVESALESLNSDRQAAKSAIGKLLGRGGAPAQSDVDCVVRFSNEVNEIVSLRESLANAIVNREKDADRSLYGKAKDALEEWKDFKRFPKLNGLSGGTLDIASEVAADLEDFQTVRTFFEGHVERLRSWLGTGPTILENQIRLESEKLAQRPISGLSPLEQALRYLLHRIGNTARMHPGPVCDGIREWFMSEGIFIEKKEGSHTYLNSFFINRKWPLYTSPYSTRRNFACPIKTVASVEEAEALWGRLQHFANDLAHDKAVAEADYDGAQALLGSLINLELSRVAAEVPADVAHISLPERFKDVLPGQYTAQIAKGAVTANTFRRAFNAYTSVLNGLAIRLRRQVFYLRTKFTWVDNTEILYVPKNAFWAVPERYRSIPEWKVLLESDRMVWNGTRLDVKATFEKLKADIKDRSDRHLIRFLVQMPHDWFYELPVAAKDSTKVSAVSVRKKDCKAKSVPGSGIARLVGPSSMKSRLDARLLAEHGEDVGDMTILYDVKVRQSITSGNTSFEYEAPMLSLAVPIRESPDLSSSESPVFSRIVAIDQGEAGLAYAVFNLSDFGNEAAAPIASGTIRISSIRRLIKAGQVFRKGKQLVQKFNQRFDSTMFNMRENVVGDVCSVIEGLMHRFHAFPVLENEVRNLESGAKQLTLVYKAVNNRFLLSDSDMPNAERAAWWYGAKSWSIPGFTFIKKDGSSIPLRVYPGISVSAANTSRICSVCRRNAFEIVKALEEQHQKKVTVQEGGVVSIQGFPPLRLFREVQDASLRSQYIRQNLYVPMLDP